MNPQWLFPLLAVAFGLAAAWQYLRTRQFGPSVRTWLLLAVIFGAVSVWLHQGAAVPVQPASEVRR